MRKNKYIKAIEAGSELVIISKDHNDDSAIFWQAAGKIYSFCRSFGTMERTDINHERLTNHILNMIDEESEVYIRGRND